MTATATAPPLWDGITFQLVTTGEGHTAGRSPTATTKWPAGRRQRASRVRPGAGRNPEDVHLVERRRAWFGATHENHGRAGWPAPRRGCQRATGPYSERRADLMWSGRNGGGPERPTARSRASELRPHPSPLDQGRDAIPCPDTPEDEPVRRGQKASPVKVTAADGTVTMQPAYRGRQLYEIVRNGQLPPPKRKRRRSRRRRGGGA